VVTSPYPALPFYRAERLAIGAAGSWWVVLVYGPRLTDWELVSEHPGKGQAQVEAARRNSRVIPQPPPC